MTHYLPMLPVSCVKSFTLECMFALADALIELAAAGDNRDQLYEAFSADHSP